MDTVRSNRRTLKAKLASVQPEGGWQIALLTTCVCPCIYIYTSSQAGLVVPAPHSQEGKVKLFFVRDARHHSRWAHLSSALRDSCSAAAWLVWPLRALPQPFCTGLAKLTLHRLLSEVIQLCTELSTNAGGASSINNCKATRGRQENVWDGASFPPSCKLLLTKQWH